MRVQAMHHSFEVDSSTDCIAYKLCTWASVVYIIYIHTYSPPYAEVLTGFSAENTQVTTSLCIEPHMFFILHIYAPQERKEGGKRGRKPGRKATAERVDMKAKLERSRQSARECRARKKLRYQYLEDLVAEREKAVLTLRMEIERVCRLICIVMLVDTNLGSFFFPFMCFFRGGCSIVNLPLNWTLAVSQMACSKSSTKWAH